MTGPSLELLRTALIVMGISTACLALGIYFMMQVRYSRDLAREARRLMFANLIVPPWDGKNLESLWISSSRQDREIIENVLAGQSQFLEGKGAATFERAVTGCGIYGSLIHKLQSGPIVQRVHAAKMLGYFHDSRGIHALVNSVHDPSPEIAMACLISLGRLKSASAIPALIGFIQTGPASVPDITLVAALAACALERPGSIAVLLDSQEERSRIVGAWAISEVADQTVLPSLLKAARDSNPEVRAKIARALARIPMPTSVETLISLAQDPVWFVRVRALDALGLLHAPEGERVALTALADQAREVRYRAAFALRLIKGMDGGVVVKTLAAGSSLSFDSLISEWERAGFIDGVVDELSGQGGTRLDECKEILRVLIAAGVTSALENLVLVHPNSEVRLSVLRLLLKNRNPSSRDRLMALTQDSRCDGQVAKAILEGVTGAAADCPSEAGSA